MFSKKLKIGNIVYWCTFEEVDKTSYNLKIDKGVVIASDNTSTTIQQGVAAKLIIKPNDKLVYNIWELKSSLGIDLSPNEHVDRELSRF